MPEILVRNLDGKIVDSLKRRAKREGRSLQSEVKLILERAALEPRLDAEKARKLVTGIRTKLKGRDFPDSAELIREDRER